MASGLVFVDDAVLGHLPAVCAKTGAETPDRLIMTVPVGRSEGLGIAWLLLLLGPLGWLGLVLYVSFRRREILTVKLPYCDAAFGELVRARRARRTAGIGAIALFFMALVVVIPQSSFAHAAAAALAVIGVGTLCIWVAETRRVRRAAVQVDLDGSRRWVTLRGISQPLADAISRSHDERAHRHEDLSRA